MDTSALAAAYDELLDAARGEADVTGQWTREILLAHICVHDTGVARAVEAVLAGADDAAFDNYDALDEDRLRRHVTEVGHGRLVAELRSTRDRLVAAVAAVNPEQAAREVRVELLQGDVVRVDGLRPLRWLVTTVVPDHLRAHLEELRGR